MSGLPGTVPELVPIEDSSNVRAIGYDDASKYLYIQFHPESERDRPPTYRYANVPSQIYRRFLGAPSKGMFVWASIKGKYDYAKWTGFGWRKAPALQKMSAQKARRKKLFKSWNR
jgi:hypothetical protein